MATFDPTQRQIIVRIVYDGVGHAGKTTNLQQLIEAFSTARRGELVSRDTKRGRTLFFDWLQVEGGTIGGHAFRSELLTVPGQTVLRQRRLYLLHRADVIVLVVDSTPHGVREGIVALQAMQECLLVDPPPLVVQANKQDMPGALAPEQVLAQLGLPASVPVVGAVAAQGVGVRDTALLAMREAARALTPRVLRDGPQALDGELTTPDSLYHDMSQLRVEVAFDAAVAPPRRQQAAAERARVSDRPSIPLPTPAVPSQYIWPGLTGRELLRQVPQVAVRREELSAQQGKHDGSARADTLVYQAGDYCLKTSLRRRFASEDAALAALVGLARRKKSLGPLLPSTTVLVLQPEDDAGLWLWTVSRWTPSLRANMASAEKLGADAGLGDALVQYAQASFDAIALVEHGMALDINPSNFAREAATTVYLDDDIDVIRALPAIGYAWLKRVDEYAQAPAAVERYVCALEQGIAARVGAKLAAELELTAALEQTMLRTDLARAARARLLSAAQRKRT